MDIQPSILLSPMVIDKVQRFTCLMIFLMMREKEGENFGWHIWEFWFFSH